MREGGGGDFGPPVQKLKHKIMIIFTKFVFAIFLASETTHGNRAAGGSSPKLIVSDNQECLISNHQDLDLNHVSGRDYH